MAKPVLPPSAAIRALLSAEGRLAVRVTPNARADAVIIDDGEGAAPRLHIRVTATPEDGKANAAVIALVAKALGTRKSALTVVQGHSARTKVIAVTD